MTSSMVNFFEVLWTYNRILWYLFRCSAP